jgi:hypothetical protein
VKTSNLDLEDGGLGLLQSNNPTVAWRKPRKTQIKLAGNLAGIIGSFNDAFQLH